MQFAPRPRPDALPEVCVTSARMLLLSLVLPCAAIAQTQPSTPGEQAADGGTSFDPTNGATAAPVNAEAAALSKKAKNPLANAVQARTPEAQAAQSGFQFITEIDHYLGMGTFIDETKYANLYAYLTILPQYLFHIGKQVVVVSATLRGTYEYTLPDADTGRHWSTYDTPIGISTPALVRIPGVGIAVSPSFSLTVPTSLESWNAGLITTARLGVTLSRSVGPVDFRAIFGGSGSIYGQQAAGLRPPSGSASNRDTQGNQLTVCRTGEALCAIAGNNTAFLLQAGGQIQWRITGSIILYANYFYLRYWKYAATNSVDEYTPRGVDSNGNPVAKVGMGNADRVSTTVGVSYQLNEHYSMDLGVYNAQTPLTPTGQVRFPFLSIGTWADNATSVYFSLTAAY